MNHDFGSHDEYIAIHTSNVLTTLFRNRVPRIGTPHVLLPQKWRQFPFLSDKKYKDPIAEINTSHDMDSDVVTRGFFDVGKGHPTFFLQHVTLR